MLLQIVIAAVLCLSAQVHALSLPVGHTRTSPRALGFNLRGGRARAAAASEPLAVVVSVEIVPERVPEFLEAMQIDVSGSREEAGCLRFDLLKDADAPNKFVFYEVYADSAAAAVHKETSHYKAWADFKASGGVVNQATSKCTAIDFTS
eukprot:CAMPEP_0119373790 /NCGR_PEP_ID=MMETSP1334-20130426/27839_1 /TAXON_ID=127549 /ORGANISM="Calcidiscus leptoporus, Strain RCC1130" /LENGTH=148 /DNA_ID=CAMNT_0007391663 /DNA_START=14 /DNA_END=460 /DNA_ORIENTATION=-